MLRQGKVTGKERNGILLLVASTMLMPAVATAQDAQTAAENDPGAIQEVVVTAQRREERLLDVPIAISVIGGTEALAAGVVNTRELAYVTPGLIGGQTGFAFLPSIRGISSTGTGAGDEANVATYVDNVYIATSTITAFNLANVDQIEVLKGPQGTLFGRNATGGAIRVITSDPTFGTAFKATVSGGFTKPDSREVSVYGSTGLSGTVAASLDVYYYDDNGYLKNADPNFSGERQGSLYSSLIRGKLLFQPTDRVKIVGEADYGQTISGVELTTAFVNNVNQFKNVVGVIFATQPREVATNEQNFDKASNHGAYINAAYEADAFTINSISAARQSNLSISLDNDRNNLTTNRTMQRNNVRTYSQELNFTSDFSGPLNFVAGAYFFDEDATNPVINIYAARISPVVDGVRTVTGPLALTSSTYAYLKTKSYSAFGEMTYKFNDQVSVVGGVRYSIDYKKAFSTNLLVANGPSVTTSNNWDNVSYRLTANYKPTTDSLIYLTHSTGFKSGNINAPTFPFPAQHDQVLPETVSAFELGYKARLLESLDLAASAYHYDYKNIQITTNNALSAAAGRVGINILQNAARGDITGADAELKGRVDDNWSWQLGLSWLPTAKYAEFTNGLYFAPAAGGLGAVATAGDLSGTRILRSPKLTVNAGVNFQTEVAGGELMMSTNYYRTSGMFLTVGPAVRQPSYNILAAEIGWTDPSEHYNISLWGRNLTDAVYYVSANVNAGGFAAVWGKPREVGARLRIQY